MKLSDKILLGFFGVIFIYLTAAFVEVRLTGTLNVIDDKSGIAETVDMPAISHVVLDDLHSNTNIVGSDRDRLEVRSVSGDLLKELRYEVSGDTLRLSRAKGEITGAVRISVFVSRGLKGISVNSSDAVVKKLRQAQLRVSQNSGHVWMSDSRITAMDIDLSNGSSLDISGTELDSLSARIERSNAYVNSPVGVVSGSLTNNALLQVVDLQDIVMKKDKSSKLNMY